MFYAVAATLLIAAVVIAVIGVKSRNGTLKRNWLAGTRLPATMKDDHAWATTQRTGWYWYIVNSVILCINGIGLIVLVTQNAANETLAFWILSWAAALLVVAAVQSTRSNNAARRLESK